MAEAFLQVVLENLSTLIKKEIGLLMGVEKEMQKLCSTLTTIQAVLEDAEDKQIQSKPIRDWLCKLNSLTYEIDDILDDCNTHVSKLNNSESKLSRYSLKKILYRNKIGRRMKQVAERLDSVAAERAKFHLRELPVDRPREKVGASRETGSMLNEPDKIYGREEDRDKIVKMLVEDVREEQEMSVLPILGVGGLGKTTVAQLVFNDPRVVDHFDKRIWVCVSDDFEIKTLMNAMIESATGSARASGLQRLDALQRCVCELLSQKRYLIVLDDVWNDQQEKWYELKDILSCGSVGASIIVTTRLKKVAEIMGTLPPHCLKGLSDDHCWMLLEQRAFGPQQQEGNECPIELEVIGKEIVKKCAGVPLAAKALGGILRFKRTANEWMYVRESEIWKLSPEESLIMPALRLSYHHLPMELRQCFAYFAAFPKDYQVKKEELILLWMAHGFVSSKGTLEAEDVGDEICNELLLRSLLQLNHGRRLVMHDLIHDLAQSVMENKVPGIQNERKIITNASTIRQVNFRHRYVMFPKIFQEEMRISSIMEIRSLRVLDARVSVLKCLPPSIGNLKHLRSLDLSYSGIRTLPNSLCTLWNLLILNLQNCRLLVALPKNTRHLHNLRHLCLRNCVALREMPSRIGELTQLKTLSMFLVGHNRGNKLEELQFLNLNGRLEIRNLERVKDHMDARKANIGEKKNLRNLSLWWERHDSSELEQDIDEKVLEELEPHPNLEELCISGFGGRYFPPWMGSSTLGKIVEIIIKDCRNCRRLPKLGELPHLKLLFLIRLEVEYIMEDEAENMLFIALDTLHLSDLPNLKRLSKELLSEEAFPNLRALQIERCSSFILPPISSLQKLEDLYCTSSTLASFPEFPTLGRIQVTVDENTACFPMEMLVKFTNLRFLTIYHANKISAALPVEGLKRLEQLWIQDCERLARISEGLFPYLTSLRGLKISACAELSDLPEEIKNVENLEWVYLSFLPKMVCVPQALRHVDTLRSLSLYWLSELRSIPEWLHQLRSLSVSSCLKVVSIPALPNLKELTVRGCPQLERRCRRGRGEDWDKISHIPRLRIGD